MILGIACGLFVLCAVVIAAAWGLSAWSSYSKIRALEREAARRAARKAEWEKWKHVPASEWEALSKTLESFPKYDREKGWY